MGRDITEQEKTYAAELLREAQNAMKQIEDYDQERVDRLCRALAWAVGNEKTFGRLADMGIEESGVGDPVSRPGKRFKIQGVLRDALRQKSMGIVEEDPAKGIVKYAKPAGVIVSLIPMTNPEITPVGTAINAMKAKDAVIFSPHPRTTKTTLETVNVMRAVLKREGVPEDLFQCVSKPSIPLAQELMSKCDLVFATGGSAMVKAAYSSGTPSFGVGAGNSTMVIDETANIEEAARNSRLSKTSDYGSGCSADGNLLIEETIYNAMVAQLILEGGYVVNAEEKAMLEKVMWDEHGHRTLSTIAVSAQTIAKLAGFEIPSDRSFMMIPEQHIGKAYKFSGEKLCVIMSLFKYSGFEQALEMVKQIYEVGGK